MRHQLRLPQLVQSYGGRFWKAYEPPFLLGIISFGYNAIEQCPHIKMSILIFYVWVISSAIFFQYFYSVILLGVTTSSSPNDKSFFCVCHWKINPYCFSDKFWYFETTDYFEFLAIISIQDFNFDSRFYTRSLQFLSQVSIDKFFLTIAG